MTVHSPFGKTQEKVVLPSFINNIQINSHQQEFREKHSTTISLKKISTTTALHTINNIVKIGFKLKKPPQRAIPVAIDMSAAFDAVHLLSQ